MCGPSITVASKIPRVYHYVVMKGPLGDPTAKYRVCIEFAETRTNASPVPLHLPRRADLVAISGVLRGGTDMKIIMYMENPKVPDSSVLIVLWKFIESVQRSNRGCSTQSTSTLPRKQLAWALRSLGIPTFCCLEALYKWWWNPHHLIANQPTIYIIIKQ
jgi:hypothetical protein